MEVCLYQLYALLRADKYNVALLSGKVDFNTAPNRIIYMCNWYVYTGTAGKAVGCICSSLQI